jgi:hypothetical protein
MQGIESAMSHKMLILNPDENDQGHSTFLAIPHRGAKRAILTRVKAGIEFSSPTNS